MNPSGGLPAGPVADVRVRFFLQPGLEIAQVIGGADDAGGAPPLGAAPPLPEPWGGNVFPPVADAPYPLVIGPLGYYWFEVTPTQAFTAS